MLSNDGATSTLERIFVCDSEAGANANNVSAFEHVFSNTRERATRE